MQKLGWPEDSSDAPSLNIKCIIFSLLMMALMLVRVPLHRPVIVVPALVATFVVAYVGMAWYDYVFDCRYAPLLRGAMA